VNEPLPGTDADADVDADLAALDALFERLGGFDDTISLEWFDGGLAALICGPRALQPGEWLPQLVGEAWERTFADPDDVAQALAVLTRRWNAVAAQLDPEALFADPDRLRLVPLMDDHDPALRDRLVAEGKLTPEEVKEWPGTGEIWALGFLETIERLGDDWHVPDDGSEDAVFYRACLACLEALVEHDDARRRADLAARYPGKTPSRDQLIDDALFAVQDLRVFWRERAVRPAPRRAEKLPGRNDPCPCGSGRKFKKCHGAPGSVP
jgi:uncharacterized protein